MLETYPHGILFCGKRVHLIKKRGHKASVSKTIINNNLELVCVSHIIYACLLCIAHLRLVEVLCAIAKSVCVIPELLAEFLACEEDTALDGAERKIQLLCDFVVFVTGNKHVERYAILVRK